MYPEKKERDQLVVNLLENKFSNTIEFTEIQLDMLCITVKKGAICELLLFLRDHADLRYNFLTSLCGMHYPDTNQLGVVYHLQSFVNNHRIRIKTATDLNQPTIPSITNLWPAANWMERETYDFYGIIFEGHPNLKRILNMDEMTDFPLRKDFPLEDQTREDKDDSMFGR
ncbi:MAG TPA: NADH-quinone oxidoreductase subunit C [Prolixibacteraceae bacterium]